MKISELTRGDLNACKIAKDYSNVIVWVFQKSAEAIVVGGGKKKTNEGLNLLTTRNRL